MPWRLVGASREQASGALQHGVILPQPQPAVHLSQPLSDRAGYPVHPLPLLVLAAEPERAVRPRSLDDRVGVARQGQGAVDEDVRGNRREIAERKGVVPPEALQDVTDFPGMVGDLMVLEAEMGGDPRCEAALGVVETERVVHQPHVAATQAAQPCRHQARVHSAAEVQHRGARDAHQHRVERLREPLLRRERRAAGVRPVRALVDGHAHWGCVAAQLQLVTARDAPHSLVDRQRGRNGPVVEQGVHGALVQVGVREPGEEAQIVGEHVAVLGPDVAHLLGSGERHGDAHLVRGGRQRERRCVGVARRCHAVGEQEAGREVGFVCAVPVALRNRVRVLKPAEGECAAVVQTPHVDAEFEP